MRNTGAARAVIAEALGSALLLAPLPGKGDSPLYCWRWWSAPGSWPSS